MVPITEHKWESHVVRLSSIHLETKTCKGDVSGLSRGVCHTQGSVSEKLLNHQFSMFSSWHAEKWIRNNNHNYLIGYRKNRTAVVGGSEDGLLISFMTWPYTSAGIMHHTKTNQRVRTVPPITQSVYIVHFNVSKQQHGPLKVTVFQWKWHHKDQERTASKCMFLLCWVGLYHGSSPHV